MNCRGQVILIEKTLTPSSEENDRCLRRGPPNRCGDFAAIHVWHAEIRDDGVEWLFQFQCRPKRVDPRLTTLRGGHPMAVALKDISKRLDDNGVIVHNENP